MNRRRPRQVLEVRQSSGALAMEASRPKAPEDWRTPRRYHAIRRFMIPMRAEKTKGGFPFPETNPPLDPSQEGGRRSSSSFSSSSSIRWLGSEDEEDDPVHGAT